MVPIRFYLSIRLDLRIVRMSFTEKFCSIIDAIVRHDYAYMHEQTYEVPDRFNWTRGVFEPVASWESLHSSMTT
jgi:hypothetical protein